MSEILSIQTTLQNMACELEGSSPQNKLARLTLGDRRTTARSRAARVAHILWRQNKSAVIEHVACPKIPTARLAQRPVLRFGVVGIWPLEAPGEQVTMRSSVFVRGYCMRWLCFGWSKIFCCGLITSVCGLLPTGWLSEVRRLDCRSKRTQY